MAKKTISNTFTVNTIIDGDDAAIAFATPSQISIPCYYTGYVKAQKVTSVTFSLKVGTNTATVTSCAVGTKPTGVTVQGQANNAVTITVGTSATASGLSTGVTFTVTGTYGGKTYSATITVALIGSTQGEQGERGKVGRFFYFGGTFNAADTTQTFIINDAQAPYFEHTVDGQKRYHVFNYDTNGTYTMSQMWAISSNWNNKPWEVMTNNFKYIITEALFTDFAKLGSGVFNEDWLLSAYGKREKVLKSSSSSINQGTNYNYIKVPNMTSIDVIKGNIYSFYITWYSASGYNLFARVAISTDGGSNYDTTDEFYSTGDSTSHVDVLSFRARFTGKATLFYCGIGTITKVVTYDDSTISGTNTGYRKFTPSFPNTDYVHINASNAGTGVGSTTYSYVSLSKFTVVQGMTYKLQMDGIIQSGSGTCYVSVYKYSDNTPINLYGAENTEGVYYSTTTDGGYYRMYFNSNSTRITKAASFTPNFSGEIVVMGRISSSGVVGNLQNMILIPVNPFVPKVAIDWLSGYAHFGGDSVHFNPNGSGWLANKNIEWDENGSASFKGNVTATNGEFTGNIYAKGGTIGGFTIDDTGKRFYNSNWNAGIDINYDSKTVKIGKNAQGVMNTEDAIIRAENTKTKSTTSDTYNTALYLNAAGAKYNYAFYGSGNGVLNGFMQGYKVHVLTLIGAATYLNLNNGQVQAIASVGTDSDKIVYLPTLENCRNTLGISVNDNTANFSCCITIINQSAIQNTTYNRDNVYVRGGSQAYTDEITTLSTRPVVLAQGNPKSLNITNCTTCYVVITYINKRFIANYITTTW